MKEVNSSINIVVRKRGGDNMGKGSRMDTQHSSSDIKFSPPPPSPSPSSQSLNAAARRAWKRRRLKPLNAAAFLLPPSSLHRRSLAPYEHRRAWKRRRLKFSQDIKQQISRSKPQPLLFSSATRFLVDNDGEIYFTCKLHIGRQIPEGSSSRSGERDLPSSGNQCPGPKRGDHGDKRNTPAKGDDVKNPKKKENPAEGCSERKYCPSSEKSKSVGGNEKIDAGVIPSESNRLISSPAIQESEQAIADGENSETKEGLTNPRERKKLDYADMELVIKECNNALGNASSHGTLKVLLYFLRKLVKNDDEKNFDEEMKSANGLKSEMGDGSGPEGIREWLI